MHIVHHFKQSIPQLGTLSFTQEGPLLLMPFVFFLSMQAKIISAWFL